MRNFLKNTYAPLLLLTYIVLAGIIIIPTLIIWHSGENWSKKSQVEYQKQHDALFALGLIDYEVSYKKELYKDQKPVVTIIGSSRTLQYLQNMFKQPFTNMGRGIELYKVKDEIKFLTEENPNLKVVFWGFDYSNYGQKFCNMAAQYSAAESAVGINSENILKFSNIIPRDALNIWPMLFDGRIPVSLLLKYISSGFSNDNPAKNKLGLRTLYSNKGGYQKDGSYIYLDLFNNPSLLAQEREKAILNPIPDGGVPLISLGEPFCTQATSDLRYIHDYLQKRGIKLVVFLTPLPERHTRKIMEIEHGRKFYEDMKKELATLEPDIVVQDYLTPSNVVFDDREFIDQSHAGEVIALRILNDLVKRNPDLEEYVDVPFIQKELETCAGQPMCITDFKKYLIPEQSK